MEIQIKGKAVNKKVRLAWTKAELGNHMVQEQNSVHFEALLQQMKCLNPIYILNWSPHTYPTAVVFMGAIFGSQFGHESRIFTCGFMAFPIGP